MDSREQVNDSIADVLSKAFAKVSDSFQYIRGQFPIVDFGIAVSAVVVASLVYKRKKEVESTSTSYSLVESVEESSNKVKEGVLVACENLVEQFNKNKKGILVAVATLIIVFGVPRAIVFLSFDSKGEDIFYIFIASFLFGIAVVAVIFSSGADTGWMDQ